MSRAAEFAAVVRVARRGWEIFGRIDGAQRAAAFAYYALFSLFPLLVLLVTLGSLFFDREVVVEKVLSYAQTYAPLDPEMRRGVFQTMGGVIESRGEVGLFAGLVLVWGSLQFFKALLRAVNRAFEVEVYDWWRLPLKSLSLLGVVLSGLVLGLIIPAAARIAQRWLPPLHGLVELAVAIAISAVPTLVLFYGLTLFYRFAPRRRTTFAEVWAAALSAALLLRGLETGFVLYLKNFAKFNVVYGAFGGIMALLMWIYLSGCVVVLGACMAAARVAAPAGHDTAAAGGAGSD